MSVRLPEAIGPYLVESLLGSGGMCNVYLARREGSARRVAVKVLNEDLSGSRLQCERFIREAKTAQALQHPAIVAVLDFGENAGQPYLVMEFVSGGTIDGECGRALEPHKALSIIKQTARALAFAHQKGVVHRDLKPANLLVTPDGSVKVSDWGLAKANDDSTGLTRTGVLLGTPSYMAPEQILGSPADPSTDLYSLGIILFMLLTGRHPFPARDLSTLLSNHLKKPAPNLRNFLPDAHSRLVSLQSSLLAKNASERPSSADEVIDTIDIITGYSETTKSANLKDDRSSSSRRGTRKALPPARAGIQRKPVLGPIVLVSVLLVGLLAGLLAGMSIDRFLVRRPTVTRGHAGRKALTINEISLIDFSTVSISYTGAETSEGSVQIFRCNGIDDKVLDKELTVQFRGSSKRYAKHRLMLQLPCNIFQSLPLMLRYRGRSVWSRLDPDSLLDDAMADADRFGATVSDKELKNINMMLLRRGALSEETLGGFHSKMKKWALDDEMAKRFRGVLDALFSKPVYPGSRAAGRLLPLRRLELALEYHPELVPKWGLICERLGFSCLEPDAERTDSGWIEVDRKNLIRRAGKKISWLWLCPGKTIETYRKGDILVRMGFMRAFRGALRNCGKNASPEYIPSEPYEFRTDLAFQLNMRSAPGKWPPRRVALEFFCKLFMSDHALLVWINGHGPITFLNTGRLHGEPGSRGGASPQKVLIPVDPSWVVKGPNRIFISIAETPMAPEAVHPAGFSYFRFLVRRQ